MKVEVMAKWPTPRGTMAHQRELPLLDPEVIPAKLAWVVLELLDLWQKDRSTFPDRSQDFGLMIRVLKP